MKKRAVLPQYFDFVVVFQFLNLIGALSTTTFDAKTALTTAAYPATTSTTKSDPTTTSTTTSAKISTSSTTSDPTLTPVSRSKPATTSTTTTHSITTSSNSDFTTSTSSITDQTNFDPGTVSVVVSQFYRFNQHVIAFRCDFSTVDNALYDVEWYVYDSVFTSQVGMSASAAASYEVATDTFSAITSNLFSFDVEFYCRVTVFNSIGSPVWRTVQSPSFKSFVVSGNSTSFLRGEEKPAKFIMNIPFGCSPGQSACSLQFRFYDPDENFNGLESSISVRSSMGGIPTIQGFTEGSTDLTIYVIDNGHWHRKICEAFVDPHMRTFDKQWYENQNEGEFVLFRSTTRPMEIQMVTKSCHPSSSTVYCPCAVTFRAGGDVFTIDHCNGHTTKFLSARDGILNVYQVYSTTYLIYFPTGLTAYVYLMPNRHYFMNILIVPTPNEIGKAEGLCGNFNNNGSDDFQIRGTNTVITSYNYLNPQDVFSMSWDLTNNSYSEESLRLNTTYKNVVTWDPRLTNCIFPNERDGKSGPAVCSINENNLRTIHFYEYIAILTRNRGKRDVNQGCCEKPEPKLWPTADRREKKRRSSMSFEDAWQICHDELVANCSAYAFRENVNDIANVNQTLNNCALDVMLDGSLSWVEPHCDSFTQTLVIMLEKDIEFSENNTALAATINSLKCPNSCNSHGSCLNGSCVCDAGYGTDLCLININKPPTIENIQNGDYCDLLGEQSCDLILLVSDGFLENVTCRVVIYEAQQNGTFVLSTSFTVTCIYENFNEAYAPTNPSQTTATANSFGQRIGLSASNNGVDFSDWKYVIVLDSLCQEMENDSNGNTILLLKSGYCYIDGICYSSHTVNPFRTCESCSPDQDLFNWYSLCIPASTTNKITSVITIVAPIAGTLVAVLFAIVVVRLCCVTKHRQRVAQAQNSLEERPRKTQRDYPTVHPDQSKNRKFHLRTEETN